MRIHSTNIPHSHTSKLQHSDQRIQQTPHKNKLGDKQCRSPNTAKRTGVLLPRAHSSLSMSVGAININLNDSWGRVYSGGGGNPTTYGFRNSGISRDKSLKVTDIRKLDLTVAAS